VLGDSRRIEGVCGRGRLDGVVGRSARNCVRGVRPHSSALCRCAFPHQRRSGTLAALCVRSALARRECAGRIDSDVTSACNVESVKSMTRPNYRAKEFAEQAGVTVRTLHLYDQMGLLPPAERTESGYRLYGERELER